MTLPADCSAFQKEEDSKRPFFFKQELVAASLPFCVQLGLTHVTESALLTRNSSLNIVKKPTEVPGHRSATEKEEKGEGERFLTLFLDGAPML